MRQICNASIASLYTSHITRLKPNMCAKNVRHALKGPAALSRPTQRDFAYGGNLNVFRALSNSESLAHIETK